MKIAEHGSRTNYKQPFFKGVHSPLPLTIIFFLSGCSTLTPSSKIEIDFIPGTPSDLVFSCTEEVINKLKTEDRWWDQEYEYSYKNAKEYKAVYFDKKNITGMFLYISYSQIEGSGKIKAIARGAYFVDIGARAAAERAKSEILQCVEKITKEHVMSNNYTIEARSFDMLYFNSQP